MNQAICLQDRETEWLFSNYETSLRESKFKNGKNDFQKNKNMKRLEFI
jgi:hypothetical protein